MSQGCIISNFAYIYLICIDDKYSVLVLNFFLIHRVCALDL